MFQVIIVGAGPAGVAVAARLRQHGIRDVAILERYQFPRDKPCGGGLTGHVKAALAALDLELRVPHVASTTATVRLGGFRRDVPLATPVNIIRRREFDADLVAQVRAHGADLRENHPVEEVSVTSDHVELRLGDGRTFRSRIVVGADGAASVVRRAIAGPPSCLPHRLFMHELDDVPTGTARTAMTYDFSVMADGVRGYTWVFPLPDRRVNVGIMHYPSSRRGGPELIGHLRRQLAPAGLVLPERGVRGWPAWGYHPAQPIQASRLLTVGDAAGIDALTGEGISIAMEQAVIAGDVVAEALHRRDVSLDSYPRRLRRAVVGRELTLDGRLARMLYQRGDGWKSWMSMVLYDPHMLALYASRVDGSQVLADQPRRLASAFVRHLVQGKTRRAWLDRDLAS
jgi:geranylgeranyl reductase family protein